MSKQHMRSSSSASKLAWSPALNKRVSEGIFILILTLASFLLLALVSYRAHTAHNAAGPLGAVLAYALFWLLGYVAFVLPPSMVYLGWMLLHEHPVLTALDDFALALRVLGTVFFLMGSCGIVALLGQVDHTGVLSAGGVLGHSVSYWFCLGLNLPGTFLLLLALILVGVTWLTGLSWVLATEALGRFTWRVIYGVNYWLGVGKEYLNTQLATPHAVTIPEPRVHFAKKKEKPVVYTAQPTTPPSLGVAVELPEPEPEPVVEAEFEEMTAPVMMIEGLPELNLLDKGQPGKPMGGYTPDELEGLSRDLEQHLLDFGIQVDVVAVHPGPVITRFELQLAAGVKASRLTVLAKDLARSLSVLSVRVVEIIPGKTVVGLELPNPNRATVALSQVFSAEVYQQAHSPLTLALGVDIAGHPMVVDLAKMPHLLVAGTTGSGKSVGINAMILSLLFRATPEQVRLILVDPKMLELSVYDGIPHLLTPVVTDMKEAASALRWCVEEMERRYRLMAAMGVRHLVGFNTKVLEAEARGEPLIDPLWKPTDGLTHEAPHLTTLPYIVVVIDELADMMMVVGKKVEQLIARIAQKARASGIHLILATQRPSVDVLTGLIKSNIPTRISFQVSSKIDSRTILDQQGAEQLLGHGDMLFLAPGTGAPLRVHGAFVDDQEVHRVVKDWRQRGVPHYIEDITRCQDSTESGTGEATEDSDPLYDEAVAFVLQTRKASTSAVQRRFKIGYNRAARLMDEMERVGVVGPMDGGFRDVLANFAHGD
jgi:S-DNA-T family DNA segregation ATPase FtsK/SpoIIIE